MRRGMPGSVIATVAGLVGLPMMTACSVEFSCGSSGFQDETSSASGSLEGVVVVTTSTHPGVDPQMRCNVSLERKPSDAAGSGRVNCFAGNDADGGLLVYRGTSKIILEERTSNDRDDRVLWIDESSSVRARFEYDDLRTPLMTLRVWSIDAKWEIVGESVKGAR